MDLDPITHRALMAAGSAALVHNAPLGADRCRRLIDAILGDGVAALVDLGCGRGGFAIAAAAAVPTLEVTGVDTDPDALSAADAAARAAGVSDRVTFELGDAATWLGAAEIVVCIGASHAFEGTDAMLRRIRDVPEVERALIGDTVWARPPDRWCLDTFGELPSNVGIHSLAERSGWTIAQRDLSTLEEWDDFEHGWARGVRTIGTTGAAAFAEERVVEYGRYRGVLGFVWLVLDRAR